MEINWEEIYNCNFNPTLTSVDMIYVPNHLQPLEKNSNYIKKFQTPIKPLPWSCDFEENVLLTLEWLARDTRKDNIRYSVEMLHTHIKDFWYHRDFQPGLYVHVCFPKDLMNWRTRYENSWNELSSLPKSHMSSQAISLIGTCKNSLWTMWRMFGIDGAYDIEGKIIYRYSCTRCGTPMPKNVKMYTKLTQSKIKNL